MAETPAAEKRDLKSLFKPKSARVLRFLLKPGQQPRRLSEIAEATRVSIGQVHKLKTALLERDWIEETPEGVVVRNADQLLDAWRSEYEASGHRQGYYTPLHGRPLEEAVSKAVGEAGAHFSEGAADEWVGRSTACMVTDALCGAFAGLELSRMGSTTTPNTFSNRMNLIPSLGAA